MRFFFLFSFIFSFFLPFLFYFFFLLFFFVHSNRRTLLFFLLLFLFAFRFFLWRRLVSLFSSLFVFPAVLLYESFGISGNCFNSLLTKSTIPLEFLLISLQKSKISAWKCRNSLFHVLLFLWFPIYFILFYFYFYQPAIARFVNLSPSIAKWTRSKWQKRLDLLNMNSPPPT